jgi:predicted ATPase/GAF domain-containing protein/HPt (histidine-containing phosphotransfer) domain-containing protein
LPRLIRFSVSSWRFTPTLAIPMISIPGYTATARVLETSASLLYRGRRNRDGLPVVIKVVRDEYPSRLDLARLRQEYQLLSSIEAPEVVKALDLKEHGDGLALVLEDLGDRSVAELIGRLTVERFLELAISMAASLDAVHARGIIHRDVKPHHFLVDGDSAKTKIIDLGIATRLSRETPAISPERLVGTLAYMSPEQTGRMHRLLDRRTDQYGLGVTFYQLLTGELPFSGTDPLQLVHSHIARIARPPREMRSDVPEAVSDVIMKLLAKVPEDRYHSVAGARADLEECLHRLRAGNDSAFALGRRDARDELVVPQKLYGRATASDILLQTFERVRRGSPEFLLISGTSGVGKSALVHQIQKDAAFHGHFIAGKFDQLVRTIPYSAIATACQELIGAILSEGAAKIGIWRSKLAEALGPNAQLVVDLVPELGFVLGAQPRVPELGPTEARHRFELVFQNFLQVFMADGHPLAVFLDDMQWADPASLRFVQVLLTAGKGHLLVIGAVRENEVGAVHPLSQMLADVRKAGVPSTEVRLAPLELTDVAAFVSDALGCPIETVLPMADVLLYKTQGNPFFLGQFLKAIHQDGLLCFDASAGRWRWDEARLGAEMATANVVDFMIEKLRRLSPEAQSALKVAACIGFHFDSSTLALISGRSASEIAADLWEPLLQGLLVSVDARHVENGDASEGAEPGSLAAYRFLHDRVRQAAYALVEDDDKKQVHLRIGRLLLERYGKNPFDENLFAIVDHLNAGVQLITDPEERRGLAQLDLTAGRKARRAAAHQTASILLGACISLLDESWASDHDMLHAAYLAKAECEFLQGRLEDAFRLLDSLENHARNPLDRAPARALRINMLTSQSRLSEAVDASLETARMLGADLPTDPALLRAAIDAAFADVRAALGERSVESLIDLPPMRDPEKLALGNVLYQAIPSIYQWSMDLRVLAVLHATSLALRHGNGPVSPFFYCQYGFVHLVATGDMETSYRFGLLGIRLAEKLDDRVADGATFFMFAGLISHWRRHLGESVDYLRRGLRASLETGDHAYVGYCGRLALFYRFYLGNSLEDIELEVAECQKLCEHTGDLVNAKYVELFRQVLLNLRGQTNGNLTLDGPGFDESAFEQTIASNSSLRSFYHHLKQMTLYFAGDIDGSIKAAAAAPMPPGFYTQTEQLFFYGLAVAAKLAAAPADGRESLLASLAEAEQTMLKWAADGPSNHAHRHALLAAELAVAKGSVDEANDWYDRAIALAQKGGFLHHQAVACELAGKFHLLRGRAKIARAYLADASYAYARWGATAKANELAAKYPELVDARATGDAAPADPVIETPHRVTAGTPRSLSDPSGQLDLATVIRAARAIAGELDLGKLLERLLGVLIENAGAQRGFLILSQGERLEIAAAATVAPNSVEADLADDVENTSVLCASVVQYVARTRKTVVLADAANEHSLAGDPYVESQGPRSLLCLPLQHQGRLTGVLYLENNAATSAFDPARVELLQALAAQGAIAVDNAQLYGEVRAATAELKRANETLEQKVEERTRELSDRNQSLRRVLDHVDQGLLGVDRDGRISVERSAKVDSWFGTYAGQPQLSEYIAEDGQFAEAFAVGLEALREDVLARDLCIDQMPKRLSIRGRQYECNYVPITEGDQVSSLLLTLTDVSERLSLLELETDQKERLAAYTALMRDRIGFLAFFDDATESLRPLVAGLVEGEAERRLLHTLKGSAAMMGLAGVSELCQRAEDDIDEGGSVRRDTLERLRHVWSAIAQTFSVIIRDRSAVEVSRVELDDLADQVRAGLSPADLLARLDGWRFEAAEKPLTRLAQYARALGHRLRFREIAIDIEGHGVRLDPARFSGLWSALVHVLRNAIDHGIEGGLEREAAGKGRPRLRLAASLRGDDLVIEVEDDGRGIDWGAVRRVAADRGLPSGTDAELLETLMRSDFSTRREATATSGRGVGLSVVATAVRQLGGVIQVESERGNGTRWRLTMPSTGVVSIPLGIPMPSGVFSTAPGARSA